MKKTLFGFLFLIPLLHCSSPELPQGTHAPKEVPLQEFVGDTKLIMLDSGKTEWVLRTKHMVRRRAGETVQVVPVEFDYHGGRSKPRSHVTAQRGLTRGRNYDSFRVEGKVRVTSKKGFKLGAEDLEWDRKTNRVTTDNRVRFTTRNGDILTGRGFRSDPDLDNWEILHDVKGEFQQFEKRMDDGTL